MPDPLVAPSLRQLIGWLTRITRPVHAPLLFSTVCRIANLCLDIALFATAAGGALRLATTGDAASGLFVTLAILALAKATFAYFEQFSGHYVAFKALELLRTHVFAALWPKAPAIVTQSRSGDVLTSLTRDVDRIEVVYAHTFAPVVSAYLVGPTAVIVAVATVGWAPVSIAAVCLAISLAVVPYVGTRRAMAATRSTLELRRELTHHITDSVFGQAEVLGYGRDQLRLAEMDRRGAEVARAARFPRDLVGLRRGANVALALIAATSVVWLGRSTLSPVAVAALAAGALRVFEGPRGVEDATGYLDHSLAAARRLWDLANAPERVSDGPDELDTAAPPTVVFDNVTYAYPSAEDAPLADAVSGVNLVVPAGGHAVLVGRSGSGKSTLVQLLARYDDPREGAITIDGQPIDRYSLDSLRRHVVVVSQRNQLLDTSIAANLRLGAPRASDDQLWRVLEIAGLATEVQAMPEGLGTRVGPNGSALSGGQAQRVCLARALLMHPRVLVLDEFTAHLDASLDEEIRAALDAWSEPMTVIEVTHRLSATTGADVVAVMDRGRIIEAGPAEQVTGGLLADSVVP